MHSGNNKIRVASSVTNCICNDQRVQKIAKAISTLDCEITLIGRQNGDYCKSGSLPFSTIRFNMFFQKGPAFYMFFNIRLFMYLLTHKFDLLVANDLDTLLPNFLVSILKRIPLVYDSHEYFTGIPEIQDRPFVKFVWKTIETFIFPKLKYVMTVSDGIAELFFRQYGIKPLTVMNCSVKSDHIKPYSREELGIPDGNIMVVLQGTGINIDRGGEELIDAVTLTEYVNLFIIGNGTNIDYLKEKVSGNAAGERIMFIDTLPWDLMMKYTRAADIGMTLDKDTNINYRFSLPNKFFDYISAGIVVVAGDLPELRRKINEWGCGILINKVTPENILNVLHEIETNRQLMNDLKLKSLAAAEHLNWENESRKIIIFYERVLKENELNK